MQPRPSTSSARTIACRAIVVAAAAVQFYACDDPTKPIEGAGDPENISRVTITLNRTTGGAPITSVRVDPDGTQLPQPVGPAQGILALQVGATYTGKIEMLNDLDPKNVVDITDEVREEANFHRFFYTFSCNGVTVPTSSLDLDTQSPTPYPVGLNFQVVVAADATAPTNCTLHVELHHFESAKADGLGDVFDTDLSLDFPVTVQ